MKEENISNINNLRNKDIFTKNLTHYLKTNNYDVIDICEKLSIVPSTFSDCLNAKNIQGLTK